MQHQGHTYRVRVHHAEHPQGADSRLIVILSSTDIADPANVAYQAYARFPQSWGNGWRWTLVSDAHTDPAECLAAAQQRPWSASTPDLETRMILDEAAKETNRA